MRPGVAQWRAVLVEEVHQLLGDYPANKKGTHLEMAVHRSYMVGARKMDDDDNDGDECALLLFCPHWASPLGQAIVKVWRSVIREA